MSSGQLVSFQLGHVRWLISQHKITEKFLSYLGKAVDRELQLERLGVPSDQEQAKAPDCKSRSLLSHCICGCCHMDLWLWRKAQALCEGAAAGRGWPQRENHHPQCCEV